MAEVEGEQAVVLGYRREPLTAEREVGAVNDIETGKDLDDDLCREAS